MAFLLPLAEIAATVGSEVAAAGTALGVSEATAGTIGTAAGSAAAGFAGSKANEALASGVKSVTGRTPDEWEAYGKEKLGKNYRTATKFFNGGFPEQPTSRIPFPVPNPSGPRVPSPFSQQRPNDAVRQSNLQLDSQLYKTAINNIRNTISQQQQENTNQSSNTNTGSQPGQGLITGPNYSTPGLIAGSVYDITQQQLTTEGNNSVALDPDSLQKLFTKTSQYPVTSGIQTNNLKGLPAPANITKDQGKLLGQTLGRTFLSDSDDVMVEQVIQRPEAAPIVKQFLDFVNTVGNTTSQIVDARRDPEFAAIYKVYNGRNCSAFVNAQGKFCFKNEIGEIEVYTGRTAPLNADGSQLNSIQLLAGGFTPPLYGTWTGPNSPNNKLPVSTNSNSNTAGLLDLYSLSHDISYQDGYFHRRGDLIYISRLQHNIQRMSLREQVIAQVAMKWFTQASYVLGNIKGTLALSSSQASPNGPKDLLSSNPQQIENISNNDPGDLYTHIVKTTADQSNPVVTSLFDKSASVPITVDTSQRNDFYSGLFNGLNDIYAESINSSLAGQFDSGNQLPTFLANLQVIDISG
jgi:hypothetical protein